jgi:hypothetical protein
VLPKRQSFFTALIVSPHALQDLARRALDEKGLVAIPFPCPRTNASDWINTDLGTRVLHVGRLDGAFGKKPNHRNRTV